MGMEGERKSILKCRLGHFNSSKLKMNFLLLDKRIIYQLENVAYIKAKLK